MNDFHAELRREWLCELQHRMTPPQSDFEKSAAWRGVFIAAFIVVVINIPASPPTGQAHAPVRATV
ncbi:hypothetical protein [Paraburkholderia phytofirmans]|uniref:Uncharacterized protein n=1 Tax=Paraburkholderia phytofirmans (strain DSM 17436 / LMG 22146 / PsJN) TaxID=398527 RepID=B2T1W7_PARPJ|nr:hypothetical protein [Paraburkholderia phytofirmans]ACD15578.1 hypothetical protein Bphyt_1162 [Paraburkholderia phytofirmans PsJN]